VQRSGGARAPVTSGGVRLQWRRPRLLPFEVVREQAVVGQIHIHALAVRRRRLGREAVLAMASACGPTVIQLAFPQAFPGLEVVAVQHQADDDLVGHFAIALIELLVGLRRREPLLPQLGEVFVAEVDTERGLLHRLVARGRSDEDTIPPHHRRGPADSRHVCDPVDVFGLRPADRKVRILGGRIRVRSPKTRPVRGRIRGRASARLATLSGRLRGLHECGGDQRRCAERRDCDQELAAMSHVMNPFRRRTGAANAPRLLT
jgi:hypothetical protein